MGIRTKYRPKNKCSLSLEQSSTERKWKGKKLFKIFLDFSFKSRGENRSWNYLRFILLLNGRNPPKRKNFFRRKIHLAVPFTPPSVFVSKVFLSGGGGWKQKQVPNSSLFKEGLDSSGRYLHTGCDWESRFPV